MIKRALIFLGLIISFSCTENKVNLIGIWQDSPEIASGWTDTYQIFPNGTFKFNFNQMICDKRTITLIGDWIKMKNGNITLTIKQKVIVEGGKLVPAMGSCASDYDIEGGVIKTINLDKFETMILKIKDFHFDKGHENMETIKLNGKQFWKMDKNPEEYK